MVSEMMTPQARPFVEITGFDTHMILKDVPALLHPGGPNQTSGHYARALAVGGGQWGSVGVRRPSPRGCGGWQSKAVARGHRWPTAAAHARDRRGQTSTIIDL